MNRVLTKEIYQEKYTSLKSTKKKKALGEQLATLFDSYTKINFIFLWLNRLSQDQLYATQEETTQQLNVHLCVCLFSTWYTSWASLQGFISKSDRAPTGVWTSNFQVEHLKPGIFTNMLISSQRAKILNLEFLKFYI